MKKKMEKQSLACRIKAEVDRLVKSGEFIIRHMTYLNQTNQGLACGCALGVVATCANKEKAFSVDLFDRDEYSMLKVIRTRWPEVTDRQAAELEMAFEGWTDAYNAYSDLAQERGPKKGLNPDSEWVKLGQYIHKLALKGKEAPELPGSRHRHL